MRVAVIGCGKVGACFVSALQQAGHVVYVHDTNTNVVTSLVRGEWPHLHVEEDVKLEPAEEWTTQIIDYAVIVVPTPSIADGSFSDRFVQEALRLCDEREVPIPIVVSTVSPGTNLGRAVYAPTMIALGRVMHDIHNAAYWLVGGPDDSRRPECVNLLGTIAPNALFPPLSREEAIRAKLLVNCFLTFKISFANAIGLHCRETGLDANRICSAIGLDARIGSKFLRPGEPFGGPCLPRDIRALNQASEYFDGAIDFAQATNRMIVDWTLERCWEAPCDDVRGPVVYLTSRSYKSDTNLEIESFGQQIMHEIEVTDDLDEATCVVITRCGDEPPMGWSGPVVDPFTW